MPRRQQGHLWPMHILFLAFNIGQWFLKRQSLKSQFCKLKNASLYLRLTIQHGRCWWRYLEFSVDAWMVLAMYFVSFIFPAKSLQFKVRKSMYIRFAFYKFHTKTKVCLALKLLFFLCFDEAVYISSVKCMDVVCKPVYLYCHLIKLLNFDTN